MGRIPQRFSLNLTTRAVSCSNWALTALHRYIPNPNQKESKANEYRNYNRNTNTERD